jgi:NAD(P)-dependent dehydrogenase (short-subunit alcohol dehydrogenase family)
MGAQLDGMVAIITGAAGGIGDATARALSERGASLALVDLDEAGLAAVDERLSSGERIRIPADVTDSTQINRAVETTLTELGHVDILINNAGMISPAPILETSEEMWDRLLRVNVTSQFLFTKRVVPEMQQRGGGAIVNLSSVNGLVGIPNTSAYSAAKAAVIGLTRCLANELSGDDIRVNAICPGSIDTAMPQSFLARFPESERAAVEVTFFDRQLTKRYGTPEEVGDLIAFLASPQSSFITGAAIPIDGGWTSW